LRQINESLIGDEPEGREFESLRAHHSKILPIQWRGSSFVSFRSPRIVKPSATVWHRTLNRKDRLVVEILRVPAWGGKKGTVKVSRHAQNLPGQVLPRYMPATS